MTIADLLTQDVCMPGVAGGFGDHPEIDEPQIHRSDKVMLDDIIEPEPGRQLI